MRKRAPGKGRAEDEIAKTVPPSTTPAPAPQPGGRRSRDKGARREREIVNLHRELGIPTQRVPLSGACGGAYSGDVDIYIDGLEESPIIGEVKARANGQGFKTIEKFLGDNDVLFLRRDHASPMIVLPWRTWIRLIKRRR